MNILAFDTSTEIFSVCLAADRNYFEFSCSQGYKHSETLVTEIESLLKKADIKSAELDLIVCPGGPGSFTGLRIGMSTAKGISLGSDTPMVTVPTLDMMAYGFDYFDGVVVPIIDARKKRFYTAFFTRGNKISDDLDLAADDIFTKLNDYSRILFTGPDGQILADMHSMEANIIIDPIKRKGFASNLIPLGRKYFKEYGPSPDTEGPIYLRKSEAEIGITSKK
ncbi:MAG: tRNA (adenosine(37)-N6)-threonylcarbamoyltransferase complex dimerization subunit type 1 TsaB [Spirochaetales bacterium]|nr:tRNA (adenosine(37)-N6)-threonylcarbamoyltransferase complex dimerization subunit type 1 TsaB [Spirochaetales bacterium]